MRNIQEEMSELLKNYRKEMQQELENILSYWIKYSIDLRNGGFYGKINNTNKIQEDAPKGSVLNSRILWTFSAAYNLTKRPYYLQTAERAFKYINSYFIDKEFDGVYWTVDYSRTAADTRKQIYALAFAIYGLSEYYKASEDERAKQLAINLYKAIIKHSYDKVYGGYFEAFTRDWKEISDFRLSAKDSNEKKSMNTHLHILEGFANLYLIWPDVVLKQQIVELINIFLTRIIDAETNHLVLFFDERWNRKSSTISFGHDIEAAWLVQEAAEIIQDEELAEKVKVRSLEVAEAVARGLDTDGGLWYEKDVAQNHLIKEKHWWPQAEAMVGFYNAYQISGDPSFLERSWNSWKFVQQYILDEKDGEWFWGINEDYTIMQGEDKVGLWKCPYHNGRACIEIIKRVVVE
ncbi:AGE family epimerase/isomerase [Segetibacter sp.]|jgi:mannobiose 2-epimerase|uniref:AGE family epimerase/isomerase n=1 Tax=Segetibacter sp. TaxID=2231182 RepID=UPI0026224D8A|nr:AGE family epimerase/isomerase [Segetibacter sp.]MCW3080110.1 N-acylglucosamine 2-epimerase [Segetibacter sp.]